MRRMTSSPPRGGSGPSLWRLSGRARDQRGHGGGSAAAGGRRTRLAITHQTGERDLEMVRDGYRRAGLEARVEPFLFEMDREMKAADLVVCRAGATTLAELTAAGRPSIWFRCRRPPTTTSGRTREALVGRARRE